MRWVGGGDEMRKHLRKRKYGKALDGGYPEKGSSVPLKSYIRDLKRAGECFLIVASLALSSSLKKKIKTCSSETSVNNRTIWRDVPKDSIHSHRCENLN